MRRFGMDWRGRKVRALRAGKTRVLNVDVTDLGGENIYCPTSAKFRGESEGQGKRFLTMVEKRAGVRSLERSWLWSFNNIV